MGQICLCFGRAKAQKLLASGEGFTQTPDRALLLDPVRKKTPDLHIVPETTPF